MVTDVHADAEHATAIGQLVSRINAESPEPIYTALGCHDVVGIGSDNLHNTDFSYGKDLFVQNFGPDGRTCYSFDQGRHTASCSIRTTW